MRNVTYPVFSVMFAILGIVSLIGAATSGQTAPSRLQFGLSGVILLVLAVLWEVARRVQLRPPGRETALTTLGVFVVMGVGVLCLGLVFALVK